MSKFIAPYWVTKNIWGISSKDLALAIDEPIEKVNWLVMKARYGKNFFDHEIVQLTGNKNSTDATYALVPFAAMGVCFMRDKRVADYYGYYLLLDRDRWHFFRKLSENKLPERFTNEGLRDHLEFLKKSIIQCKSLKVKNEIIRRICSVYSANLNLLRIRENHIDCFAFNK